METINPEIRNVAKKLREKLGLSLNFNPKKTAATNPVRNKPRIPKSRNFEINPIKISDVANIALQSNLNSASG